jgi:hypothetical protein
MIASPQESPVPASLEPLADLELQIARRADELAATRLDRSSLNLVCWLQAEQEILDPILKKSTRTAVGHHPLTAN